MLYFSLPNFFENVKVNNFLYTLNKYHPDYFKENITIEACNGAVPYLCWSGGINSNVGTGALYPQFTNCQQNCILPIYINCANVLLEESDYDDNLGNVILDIFDNGSNVIEISSIPFMEYISENYPNYHFCLSKQADLITEFTPELLNALLDSDKFKKICLPDKLNDNFDFIKELSHRNKIEITINPICSHHICDNPDACLFREHKNQLDYYGEQLRFMCTKRNQYLDTDKIPSLEELKKTYAPYGINHFTFTNTYELNELQWVSFYIAYFIKQEYVMLAQSFWEGEFYNAEKK